jgi:hypothetical protein
LNPLNQLKPFLGNLAVLAGAGYGHLNETQRASVAAKLANMPVGRNWKDSNSANLQNNQVTQTQAADMLSVSPRSVRTAKMADVIM